MALLGLTTAAASAQVKYHVQETFYQGDTFNGVITFASDLRSILSVNGSLISPYESPLPKLVNGIDTDSVVELRTQTRQISFTGPDGYPWGYLLSFAWEIDGQNNLTLPIFITHSVYDPVTGSTQDFYSNSINGWNYATSATLSPVPEPTQYIMLLGGLGLLLRSRRNKHTT